MSLTSHPGAPDSCCIPFLFSLCGRSADAVGSSVSASYKSDTITTSAHGTQRGETSHREILLSFRKQLLVLISTWKKKKQDCQCTVAMVTHSFPQEKLLLATAERVIKYGAAPFLLQHVSLDIVVKVLYITRPVKAEGSTHLEPGSV